MDEDTNKFLDEDGLHHLLELMASNDNSEASGSEVYFEYLGYAQVNNFTLNPGDNSLGFYGDLKSLVKNYYQKFGDYNFLITFSYETSVGTGYKYSPIIYDLEIAFYDEATIINSGNAIEASVIGYNPNYPNCSVHAYNLSSSNVYLQGVNVYATIIRNQPAKLLTSDSKFLIKTFTDSYDISGDTPYSSSWSVEIPSDYKLLTMSRINCGNANISFAGFDTTLSGDGVAGGTLYLRNNAPSQRSVTVTMELVFVKKDLIERS